MKIIGGIGAIGICNGDAWFFDRKNSPGDASPVIAEASAYWLLGQKVEEIVESAYETTGLFTV